MIAIIVYFITFYCVTKYKHKKQITHKNFPLMKLRKSGIVFNSFLRHRIKITNSKTMQIGTRIYVKTNSKLITIINVDKVFKHENYLYFSGLGKVQILFDCNDIYKYFNIEIISTKFSIEEIRQEAICELINNNFEINFCKILKKYIKIIENILNICIFQKKIVIKQNKFHLPFTLKYKLNNRIKQVCINETLEEN